jgi:hypothetical protein
MSLIDSTVLTALGATNDQSRSLNFVKNIMKGLLYADLTAGSGTITGQVRTGDGVAKAAVTDVLVRVVGTALLTTSVGTEMVGAPGGAVEVWLRTNSSGIFTVAVAGSGTVIVEAVVSGGVPTLRSIAL